MSSLRVQNQLWGIKLGNPREMPFLGVWGSSVLSRLQGEAGRGAHRWGSQQTCPSIGPPPLPSPASGE